MATIVQRLGSTPRKDHAKMLVLDNGSSFGSVGGGCVEAEVWQRAQAVMQSERSEILRYELTETDVENEGLVCGGSVEIFVEPIVPDPKVILMGAGHVARSIADIAHRAGFQVSVLDDRDSFANRERFPEAEEVVAAGFASGLNKITITDNSFILVVTRGHKYDQVALEQAVQTKARYVGLLGSRRKVQIIVHNLLDKGIPAASFMKLYAPIGVEIGSENPEEIAVSTVAELIAVRKGVHKRSEKQLFVEKLVKDALAAEAEENQPPASMPDSEVLKSS